MLLPLTLLPLHRLLQDIPVRRVCFGEGVAPILHAQHHKRLRAIVAHRTLALGSHPHHRTFGHGNDLPVHLELAPAAKEEIQLLVHLVRVQEACLRARLEHLEGEVAACGVEHRAAEHLARNLHVRTQLQYILVQFTQFAYADGAEVAAIGHCCYLFHTSVVWLNWLIILFICRPACTLSRISATFAAAVSLGLTMQSYYPFYSETRSYAKVTKLPGSYFCRETVY